MLVTILTLLAILYLLIGFLYAVYLLFIGAGGLLDFPINVIGGPIVLTFIVYKTLTGQRMPLP